MIVLVFRYLIYGAGGILYPNVSRVLGCGIGGEQASKLLLQPFVHTNPSTANAKPTYRIEG